MTSVSGLAWEARRDTPEQRVPGLVDQAIEDADTFFGIELPALAAWSLDAGQAAAIERPVLFVLGEDTLPLWVEVAAFLREPVPEIHEVRIEGVGHLVHLQRTDPVAEAIGSFLRDHPMSGAA